MKKTFTISLVLTCLVTAPLFAPAHAAASAVPVIALGISNATGQNWGDEGLITLNGNPIGLDVADNGYYAGSQGNDIYYIGGQGQNPEVQSQNPTVLTTIEFDPNGQGGYADTSHLGVAGTTSDEEVGAGSSLYTDVAATGDSYLIISEVTPAAGTYTLDGVSITATAEDQVLQWAAPLADLIQDNTFTFSSDASANVLSQDNVTVYSESLSGGPIGFSAGDVPEPSTWASLLLGLAGLGFLARRRVWASR